MLIVIHWIIELLYIGAPVAALIWAARRGRGLRVERLIRFFSSVIIGVALGTAVVVIHQRQANARANLSQVTLTLYMGVALILLLKGIDALLARRMRGGRTESLRAMSHLVRGFALIAIGLPLIVSAVLVYRPRVHIRITPMNQWDLPYEEVSFKSTDGLTLSGWWIPAHTPSRRRALAEDFGAKTVLLCHGWGGNKATQLVLVRSLIASGYNVLTFDFRGHGDSAGQYTTLGDLERRDVLGAVRWLQGARPDESRKIVGIGASTGAAALIAAATDSSSEGQAIQAIAVYGAYDDLYSVIEDMAGENLLSPMDRMTAGLGLMFASAHVGTNLMTFKPAALVQDLWPRPILVIHATADEVIAFKHGERLFDAATFPKQHLWLPAIQSAADQIDGASRALQEFFETARPVPAI